MFINLHKQFLFFESIHSLSIIDFMNFTGLFSSLKISFFLFITLVYGNLWFMYDAFYYILNVLFFDFHDIIFWGLWIVAAVDKFDVL